MSKVTKKAEKPLLDADTFPAESFRERLSRKFGEDAIALSGPCEGQSLVECVVNQMEKRWTKIKDRLAGNHNKAFKLATKLAESYRMKDDTQNCIGDLENLGYTKAAATGIANYLKCYAMDPAADMEMEQAMGTVMADDSQPDDAAPEPALDAPAADDMSVDAPGDDLDSDPVGELPAPAMDGVAPASDSMGEETITIDLPIEVAEQLKSLIEEKTMEAPSADMGSELGLAGEEPGLDIEVIDMTPGGDLHGDIEDVISEPAMDEVVPGEPKDGMDNHEVEGDAHKCSACGHAMASSDPKHEEKEHKTIEKLDKDVEELKSHEAEEHKNDESKEDDAEKAENKEFGEEVYKAASMRAGHLSPNGTQRIAADSKDLGSAKEKSPEEPKPISEGNLDTEGHSAGDKKFQDKSTMGHETAFDAKDFDKGSATGGKSSLMGKDESFPEDKPKVPAGSAPIGGEQFEGGNLSTKGTVIAKIKPDGVYVESDGKKYRAKGDIKLAMVEKIQAGLSKIAENFNGDAKAFAQAAAKVIKEAGEVAPVAVKTEPAKVEVKPETVAAAAQETKVAKAVEAPKPLEDGNVKAEGHTAGGDKLSEDKPDFKTVEKSEVSKGSASEMGKDEEFPTGKADVPAGGGKMGNEEFDGGNVSTKGTTIADNSQKRNVSAAEQELQNKLNESLIQQARIKAASVYVADLLANGDISSDQYVSEHEKISQLDVRAINDLIKNMKQMRSRMAANASATQHQEKVAGLSIPVVRTDSRNETYLKDQLIKNFKLTQDLDKYENMK